MPLLACGFEAEDMDYYRRLGWRSSSATFSRRYIHRSPDGYGGNVSLVSQGDVLYSPKFSNTARWLHLWFARGALPGSTAFTFTSRGVAQFSVRVEPDGTIQLRRGIPQSTLVATSAGKLDMTRGHWLAIEMVVANSGGVCNVYTGNDVSAFVSYSGDTQESNTVPAAWDIFEVGLGLSGSYLDDIIVTDSAEGRLNEQFGIPARPSADVATALTPSAGSDNWKNVNTPNDGTYNYGSGSAIEDLYSVDASSRVFGTVKFVAVQGVIGMTNDLHGRLVLKSGATTSLGDLFGGSSVYAGDINYYTQDPDTASAWTADGARAIQIGVRTQA